MVDHQDETVAKDQKLKELSKAKSKYASDNLDEEVQNILGSYSTHEKMIKTKKRNTSLDKNEEDDPKLHDESFIDMKTENDRQTGEISPRNGKVVTSQIEARVYDISGNYKPMLSAILGYKVEGIWHIGVRVYNKEYWFSTHIEEMLTHDEDNNLLDVTPFGLIPTYTYDLGSTTLNQEEFETYLYEKCAPRYGIKDYHVLKNNCNHFANEIIDFLTDGEKRVPPFVLELSENALRKFNSVHAAVTEMVANKIARVVMLAWGKSAQEGGTFNGK